MEEDKVTTLLEYGNMEGSVRAAIENERVYGMDLENTNIEISVADIDSVDNDTYVQVRRDGIGGSDISVVLAILNALKTISICSSMEKSETIKEFAEYVYQNSINNFNHKIDIDMINKSVELI